MLRIQWSGITDMGAPGGWRVASSARGAGRQTSGGCGVGLKRLGPCARLLLAAAQVLSKCGGFALEASVLRSLGACRSGRWRAGRLSHCMRRCRPGCDVKRPSVMHVAAQRLECRVAAADQIFRPAPLSSRAIHLAGRCVSRGRPGDGCSPGRSARLRPAPCSPAPALPCNSVKSAGRPCWSPR